MSFYDDLLNDNKYMATAWADLIDLEQKRIVAQNLATSKEIGEFINDELRSGLAVANIIELHANLQSVKLPGDFKKMAADKDFYKALDIPYVGEKFYELPAKKKKPVEESEKAEEKEAKEILEEFMGEEDHIEDCACDMCIDPQITLASVVNEHLCDIVSSLGRRGDHESAYAVEKTIKSIKALAFNKALFTSEG